MLHAVPALRLLENHEAVLDSMAQRMQRGPELPPVQDPQLPGLGAVAADVVYILHLVFEVREGEGRGGEGGGGGEEDGVRRRAGVGATVV